MTGLGLSAKIVSALSPFMFKISDKAILWLKKIHSANVDDKTRQEMYVPFLEAVRKAYDIPENKFFSVSTYPEENFGNVTIDKKRVRNVVKAK